MHFWTELKDAIIDNRHVLHRFIRNRADSVELLWILLREIVFTESYSPTELNILIIIITIFTNKSTLPFFEDRILKLYRELAKARKEGSSGLSSSTESKLRTSIIVALVWQSLRMRSEKEINIPYVQTLLSLTNETLLVLHQQITAGSLQVVDDRILRIIFDSINALRRPICSLHDERTQQLVTEMCELHQEISNSSHSAIVSLLLSHQFNRIIPYLSTYSLLPPSSSASPTTACSYPSFRTCRYFDTTPLNQTEFPLDDHILEKRYALTSVMVDINSLIPADNDNSPKEEVIINTSTKHNKTRKTDNKVTDTPLQTQSDNLTFAQKFWLLNELLEQGHATLHDYATALPLDPSHDVSLFHFLTHSHSLPLSQKRKYNLSDYDSYFSSPSSSTLFLCFDVDLRRRLVEMMMNGLFVDMESRRKRREGLIQPNMEQGWRGLINWMACVLSGDGGRRMSLTRPLEVREKENREREKGAEVNDDIKFDVLHGLTNETAITSHKDALDSTHSDEQSSDDDDSKSDNNRTAADLLEEEDIGEVFILFLCDYRHNANHEHPPVRVTIELSPFSTVMQARKGCAFHYCPQKIYNESCF